MKKFYNNVTELIGNTPILKINSLCSNENSIFTKCEMFNPSLSIKDRVVLSMVNEYKILGRFYKGIRIYESSSGNTGSSLAMLSGVLDYKAVITVPEKTSLEKINTMCLFGAEVIVCPLVSSDSPEHYTNKAKILSEKDMGSIYLDQYGNEENCKSHYKSTAYEIYEQLAGEIDYFIAPASSGGTITGIGRYLKEMNENIKILLADPIGSVFYDYFNNNELNYRSYEVEGAGKDKVCKIHDFSIIDDVIQFNDYDAFSMVKKIAITEGLLIGGSAGGTLHVANKVSSTVNNKNIVTISSDSGFKYLTKLTNE